MANRKIRLGKPSKSSAGLNFKVRFKYESKNGGYFIVTTKNRKAVGGKQFNNHDSALEYAKGLNNKTINV
jgi:hypothetical protein